MPREMNSWSGKPAAPPPEIPRVPEPTPAMESRTVSAFPAPPQMLCPQCARGTLRKLASGALGCSACAVIFQTNETAAPAPQRAPEEALDQIEAINAMLRRNTLVLGPGGVPLAESGVGASGGSRRANQRRARR